MIPPNENEGTHPDPPETNLPENPVGCGGDESAGRECDESQDKEQAEGVG